MWLPDPTPNRTVTLARWPHPQLKVTACEPPSSHAHGTSGAPEVESKGAAASLCSLR